MRKIEIVSYQESWPQEFREIGSELRNVVGPLALRIDHIGSTSVPGLGAKDVIDVQITVERLIPHQPVVEAMIHAGYRWREGIQEDHRPFGALGPCEDWTKLYFRERDGMRRIHFM